MHTPKYFSSVPAIQNTIRSDFHTFFWFQYLLAQEPVKKQIRSLGEEKEKTYRSCYALSLLYHLSFYITALSGILTIVKLQVLPLVLTCGLTACTFFLRTRLRNIMAVLALDILHLHYSEEQIPLMTLYQICEQLSRIYRIPSLVDTLFFSDNLMRYAFLIGFFLPWPELVKDAGFFIIILVAIRHSINLPITYRLLKF